METHTAMEHKQELDNIKMWLMTSAISYDKAKELAEPHIAAMNVKSKEIAKRHGVKPHLITFYAFMR
jgi:hypothetical protein